MHHFIFLEAFLACAVVLFRSGWCRCCVIRCAFLFLVVKPVLRPIHLSPKVSIQPKPLITALQTKTIIIQPVQATIVPVVKPAPVTIQPAPPAGQEVFSHSKHSKWCFKTFRSCNIALCVLLFFLYCAALNRSTGFCLVLYS